MGSFRVLIALALMAGAIAWNAQAALAQGGPSQELMQAGKDVQANPLYQLRSGTEGRSESAKAALRKLPTPDASGTPNFRSTVIVPTSPLPATTNPN